MSAPFRVLEGGKASRGVQPQFGRTPPHNLDAERGLIGVVLNDETPAAAALARQIGVKAMSFWEPAARVVWEAIELLVAEGSVPDLVSVKLRLAAMSKLDEVGGLAYLLTLSNGAATSLRLRQYAEEVKLLWERRHAILLATKFVEDCYDPGLTGQRGEFVATAGALGNRLVTLGRVEDVKTLPERIDDVLRDEKIAAEGKQDKSGWLFTGMPIFDRVLGAFGSGGEEDRFHGIGGGSSFGKSAAIRQWSHNWVRGGKRVLIYTRETSINGWCRRAASQRAGVNLRIRDQTPRDILHNYYAELEWMRDVAANRLLFVFQNEMSTPLVFVEDLLAHYDAFEHLHGKPDAVVVDYLQILLPKKKCNSREQEVAYVSHMLQGRQRRAGNQWFVTAQVNEAGLAAQRTIKKDENGRIQHRTPVPGDLRESQAFFHDSDRMIMLYRPPEDCTGRDQVNEIPARPEQWFCQIKGREVGVGVVKAWFERPYTRFVEFNHAELRQAEAVAAASTGRVQSPGSVSKADFKARRQGGAA